MLNARRTQVAKDLVKAKINRNFEVFTATDFLIAITQHIPDKGAQRVRYYGWYSNQMRGVRHRGLPSELVPHRPGVSPPPPLKLPSKQWRDLILRVWQVASLRSIHNSSFPPPPLRTPFCAFWAPHTRNRRVAWPRVAENMQKLALDGTPGF